MNSTCTDKKICSFCGEDIPAALMRCPYCGSVMKKEDVALELLKEAGAEEQQVLSGASPDNRHDNEFADESGSAPANTTDNAYIGDTGAASADRPDSESAGEPGAATADEYGEWSADGPDRVSASESDTASADRPDIVPGETSGSMSESASGSISGGAAGNPDNMHIRGAYQRDPGQQYLLDAISKKPLGNGIKVFLTTLSAVIPCLGQLIGAIAAILFLNSDDTDRRSFGAALLVSSLVMFVISIVASFMFVLVLAILLGGYR